MKLALLAILLFAGAPAQAAQTYLVFRFTLISNGPSNTVTVIPMENNEQCQKAGLHMENDEKFKFDKRSRTFGFTCIEGQ